MDEKKRTHPGANLRAILDDLNRPLDATDWEGASRFPPAGGKPERLLQRLRRERDHRRELRRARQAAERALGVRSRPSTRKRAAMMLTAGAASLGAFTGPTLDADDSESSRSAASRSDHAGIRLPAALLSASEHFRQALIEEEGVRYTVYRDLAGYPTVGVGHLVDPSDGLRVGDRIDERQVYAFLKADLAEAERGVRTLVGRLPLHQHEFDALLDLVYNVGLGNVSADKSPRLNRAIDLGDFEAIAAELDYTYAGGRFAKGLEYRSVRRSAIFLEAAYGDPREPGSTTSS
ncbi:lysozyme [Qipengyuania zhejiangensis]|uniref:lysozyme n=1 Tax=Qipengyuania zhejiangensis TaxID=3077782 RepID=UPI002D79E2B9|nr:lysozyme [Qipengyuania sp. Z2]